MLLQASRRKTAHMLQAPTFASIMFSPAPFTRRTALAVAAASGRQSLVTLQTAPLSAHVGAQLYGST
jgi:broad specificity phosphatase PhoE